MLTQAEVKAVIQLMDQGRLPDALAQGQSLARKHPGAPFIHNILGVIHARMGQFDAALACYDRSLKIAPDYADALNNRGNALADLGQQEAALASFNEALRVKPDFAQAHNNRGNVLRSIGLLDEAAASFRQAVRLNPQYAAALNSLGNTLREQGKYHEALDSLTRATAMAPGFVEAHNSLGNLHCDMGRPELALENYRTALKVHAGFAEGHCNLGHALSELGRYEEAAGSYQEALRLRPGYAEVHSHLSQIRTYRRDDPHFSTMLARLDQPGVSEEETMYLDFALGKAFDDIGEVDRAFEYLSEANRLKKKALGYSIERDRTDFALIKSWFAAKNPATSLGATRDEPGARRPIFVVGMPRSGTTLVEQILASHSRVYGAGELETVPRILNPLLKLPAANRTDAIKPETFSRLRESYLENLQALHCAKPVVTDKLPGNFKWVGFLLTAMPEAKIVHLRRDPAATCWSIFRHHFGGGGHGYSYDLADVAECYGLYADLMEFWHSTFPGRVYDLSYESLTEDQERETRGLLEYCGLDWEDQCLAFHETRRSVQTLSRQQVRQPMYQGSSQAWRKYQTHLAPMLEILGAQNRQQPTSSRQAAKGTQNE